MKRSVYSKHMWVGLSLFLLFCTVAPSIKAQQPFTDINANLDGAFGATAAGAAAWGDYDNDGDLDLAYTGTGANNTKVTRLYRNDDGTFVSVNAGLPDVSNGGLAWGDYDNDGDLDLFLMGIDPQFASVSDVFRNDDGSFSALGLSLPRASATVSWADFDNDGDLDILLAGFALGTNSPLLYRNNGDETFTAITTGLPEINGSEGAWGDYDSDGDLDLAVVGFESGVGGVSKIFRNDGAAGDTSWAFTDINAGLLGVQFGAVAWGDYNSDGFLDISIIGQATNENISQIYRNNGNGTFSAIGAGLEGVRFGDCAWGDHDNDGDLDLIITGRTNSFINIVKIYENDQATFTDSDIPFGGLFSGTLAWGDFDFDSDLDLFVMGSPDGAAASAQIFRNNSGTANNTPAAPTDLNSGINGTALTLVWDPASDPQTPTNGLTYNIRLGTAPGGLEVVVPMSLSSGRRQVAQMGNVQQNRLWTIENIDTTRTYYWTVQSVDNSFLGSAFAPEQVVQPKLITDTSFVEIDFGLQALAASDAEWGDIDGDGDLDFALTGGAGNQGFTHIYRNDNIGGLRSFTQVGGNLLAVLGGALAWGDFDNDNDLDLLVTGSNNSLQPQTGLFRNDEGTFTDIAVTIPNVTASSVDWGDTDHDGDLDLLLAGSSDSGTPISRIYENRNRAGSFFDSDAGLTGLVTGDGLFFDFNNDQGLEILVTGQTEVGFRFTGLYEINANGDYQNVNPSIPGLWLSAVDVGDYDSDGDLDFVVSGARSEEDPTPQDAQPFTFIYRNDISTGGGINQVDAGLKQLYRCAMDWGDYDADGDLDLLITGFDGINNVARIYRNDGNDDFQEVDAQFEPVINGAVEWGDYNNDGRLDILLTGQNSATLPVTNIYENIRQESNNTPSPPTSGFNSNVQGNQVTLSWSAGSDPQTPANGLTYNLRVGTTPGGNDVVSSATGISGLNKLARRGNTEQNRQWTIENLPPGETIYWSVQAVDNNFTPSAFSAEQSFESTANFNFTELQIDLPALRDGDAEWGDYDADGDLDLIIMGRDTSLEARTILYRNDNGSLTEVNSGLPDVGDGAVAWGDVDGDGDLDLVLSGRFSNGSRHTAVWLNADGAFARMPNTVLTAVYYSAVAWGDLEQDGDLDLVVAGLIQEGIGPQDDQVSTEVYRNEAGKRLVKTDTRVADDPTVGLVNAYRGQIALTDFNRDSKLDVFISGKGAPVLSLQAVIYGNRSSDRPDQSIFGHVVRFITYDIPSRLTGVNFSSAAWGDYDEDGFPDLLYSGAGLGPTPHTKLYRNDNGESFTEIDAGLPQLWDGDLAWGDLDNNGDLDILLTGLDADDNLHTFIRTNNQDGFSETISNLPPVSASALALGDYDNDGDLDVVVMGNSTDGPITGIYRNESAAGNALPTTPTGLRSSVNGDRVTLSWDPASDPEGGNVTYNVAMGTAANPTEVAPPHSLSDGFRQIPEFGNAGSETSITVKLDTASAYHWSVQAVDNGFAGSDFSPTASFGQPDSLSFFNVMPDIDAELTFNFDWIDFDCDGDLDLFTHTFRRVYRNDGNGVFTRIEVGPDLYARHTDWGDVDNDGDPDVLFWGKTRANADTGFVTLYQNDNGTFSEMERFFDNTDGFGFLPAVDLTDVDNDGWQDVYFFVEDLREIEIAMLLRNAGDGTFEPVPAALPSDEVRTTPWVDYDGDGDLDHLALERGSNSIFRNDGNLTFTTVPLSLGRFLSAGRWLDYDGDGDLDLFTRQTNSSTTVLYRHELSPSGTSDFVEVNNTTEIGFGAELMEFNNDANMDLIADATVFTVSANGSFRKIDLRLLDEADVIRTAWGDYDNDHDLDVALYDNEVNWLRLYRNDAPTTPNLPPAAPDGLTASVAGNYVTLSWDAATDDVTPSQTLTYNLRIGSTPGAADVVTPLSVDRGSRKIVEMGNTNLTRSWPYELEPSTTYYWSVQALDQSFAGGPFAPEQTFTTGSQSSLVRFVNASGDPNLNNLDIYVGESGGNLTNKITVSALASAETLLQDDLGYLQGSALLPVPADSTLSLAIAPGNSTGRDDAVASFERVQLAAGQTTVVSIFGVAEPAQFAPNPEDRQTALALHLEDVTRDSVAPDSNEIAIYFVHGVTDAPRVNADITLSDGTTLSLGSFSFGESSQLISVAAGETEIIVSNPASGTTLAAYVQNLSNFRGSVVPVLFSGFIDPVANQNGPQAAIAPIAANGALITTVQPETPSAAIPTEFSLLQNYPNPFNPTTTIVYHLAKAAEMELVIYNILGEKIRTLVREFQTAGEKSVAWDGRDDGGVPVTSGLYFVRFSAGDFQATKKMILMR